MTRSAAVSGTAPASLRLALPDDRATAQLGDDLALALKTGDTIGLCGDLGAGKTALARAILRTLAGDETLEVPSPTFTLVQHYGGRLPVAHVDLYRIGSEAEVDELAIDEELEAGAALVEWPERAPSRLPSTMALVTLSIPPQGGRLAEISGPAAFMARLERSLAIRGFLAAHGWGDANRLFLFGDASMRAYETATLAGETRVVMNSPRQPDGPPVRDGKPYSQIAHLAESVTPFVAVGRALKAQGFSAPVIHAADLDAGILMVEHLGGEGILDPERRPIPERYHASVNLLAELHQHRWPKALPVEGAGEHIVADYDRGAMQIEVALLTDWYLPGMTGRPASDAARESFVALWDRLIDRLASAEKTLVLRDYHSPNILWRDDRGGLDRIGLIDFQDAMIGPAAYDVASLAQDARATVPAALEHELVERYVAARGGGFDRDAFLEEYAILAAQRATKILGIFVRLNLRDGKPGYLQHLPRMQAYLARCLAHPVLAEYKAWCEEAGLLQGLEAA